MPPNVFLIEVWLAKFRFKILSLSNVIEEKPLGGLLGPFRSGRVKLLIKVLSLLRMVIGIPLSLLIFHGKSMLFVLLSNGQFELSEFPSANAFDEITGFSDALKWNGHGHSEQTLTWFSEFRGTVPIFRPEEMGKLLEIKLKTMIYIKSLSSGQLIKLVTQGNKFLFSILFFEFLGFINFQKWFWEHFL